MAKTSHENEIPFPKAHVFNNRIFFIRADIEKHKAALAGIPAPTSDGSITFVSAKKVAEELGIGRRTLGRRFYVKTKGSEATQG